MEGKGRDSQEKIMEGRRGKNSKRRKTGCEKERRESKGREGLN